MLQKLLPDLSSAPLKANVFVIVSGVIDGGGGGGGGGAAAGALYRWAFLRRKERAAQQ